MTKKPKILIVLNSSWQGYNFRMNLARFLKDNGYEVLFAGPNDGKYNHLIAEQFSFTTIDIKSQSMSAFDDIKCMYSLFRCYKSLRPDIVLNFTIKPNIYGSFVARILNIKYINNITGLGLVFIRQNFLTKIVKLFYKIALKSSSKVFFQNSSDMDFFIAQNLVKKDVSSLIAGSGVDIEKFKPTQLNQTNTQTKSDIFTFLMIARLTKEKGIFEYFQASKMLNQKYKNIRCEFLGAIGVENNALQEGELMDTIINSKVHYKGVSDDVASHIQKANCVVLPSYKEGMPRTLLEAGAMGKPVVASDVTGCQDIVSHGQNGYLCQVQDAQDLYKYMEKLYLLSQEEISNMQKTARELIIQNYDEKIVLNSYLKALKEIS